MTAIVAGQGLGLFNTSANVLGEQGQLGLAAQGRSGEKVVVNAATGNLVIQQQDEWLVGMGPDVGVLRTYNSLATGDGDNGDNWRLGLNRKITSTSTTAPSIIRVADDGAELTYANVSGKFVNKSGSGSFDTITWDAVGNQWVWEDGNTHTKEYYKASGVANEYRLVQITDADGKTITVNYDATSGMITSVKTLGGETLELTYEASVLTGKMTRIKSVITRNTANVQTLKRVTYDYDTSDRLKKVWVDLSPEDGTVADGKVYWTEYTYVDTTSKRLKTLKQSDDSLLEFNYDTSNRIAWIKETLITNGNPEVRQTSFNYGTGNTTQITDAAGQITELTYVSSAGASYGQIQTIRRPSVGANTPTTSFSYDADGNLTLVADPSGNYTVYRYDSNGNRIYQDDMQGTVIERTYGSANQVLSETTYSERDADLDAGASGAQTTYYVYDSAYPTRLRYLVSPEGRVTQYLYNGLGQRTSTIQFPAATYASYSQDFGIDTNGLTSIAGFARTNNQLQYTASTTASSATTTTVDSAPLGSLWSAQVTTPAGIGQDLLFLGLETGSAGTASYRRFRLRISNGQFLTETQSGTSANAAVVLGTAKAGTAYTVEYDTQADGSIKLYVYEKGKERGAAATLFKALGADAGWANPKLVIQGNSGAGAIAGMIAIDNLIAQKRPTLADLNTWVNGLSDKTSWSRTDYTYDLLRGQLQSETTFGITSGGLGEFSDWDVESWSDNDIEYIYDQAGNLLQKIEGTKAQGVLNSNNSWARDQRRQLGIVYTVAGPNGAVGEGKKIADLTAADKTLIQSKATFNTVFVYDGLNRITKQTDALGNVTLTTYDDAARTTTVALANGLTRTSTYDRAGSLIASSQFDATAPTVSLGATEYTYDKMGRLTSTKVASTGERTFILYDADGRKVGDIDAEGALTEYLYNDRGQITRTVGYATKVSSAVLAALAADPGAASVPANLMSNGLSGWTVTASNITKISSGLNTATSTTSASAQLAGDSSQWLKQIDADATLTSQLQSGMIALPPFGSRRFDVSTYVGVVNATASIEVQFFDTGTASTPLATVVPSGTGAVTSASAKTGGPNLSDYTRLMGYVDAPAAAKYARVVIKKAPTATGKTESYLYITHPLLAQAVTSATVAKPFAALDPRPTASAIGDRSSWNIYDKVGRLSKTITSGGGANSFDEFGSVVEYRYDGAGRLTDTIAYATSIPQGTLTMAKLRSAQFDIQAGDGTLTIDGTTYVLLPDAVNDRRTRSFYSKDGLLIGQLDADNFYTQNTYNGQGLLTASTRYGRAIVGTVAEGNTPPVPVPSTLWDLLGGLDRTTRYYYNGRKQLIGVLDAQNYYTAYQYDPSGNKSLETRYAAPVVNSDGKTPPAILSAPPITGPYILVNTEDRSTKYFYDADSRVIRTLEMPINVVSTFDYDKVGNLTKTVVALGTTDERATQKRYDAAGRVIAELGGVGSSKLAGLTDQTAINNVWKTYGVQHLYDAGGRRIATIEPDGSTASGIKTLFYYDKAGRLTHSINALGEVDQYSYNAFGQQSEARKVTNRVAQATVAGLTGGLNTTLGAAVVTSETDSVTSTAYTRTGQVRRIADADANYSEYWYNAFGETLWSQLPLLNGQDRYTEYTYNRRGQQTLATDNDTNGWVRDLQRTQYNAFGQPMIVTDARGKQVQYAYDRLGRSYIVTNIGSLNFGTVTVYDAFNRLVTQTDPYGRDTTYQYDSANRSLTVTTPEGASANFKTTKVLNRHGQTVSVTDGRGAYTQYSYDAEGRLTGTVVKNLATDSIAQTSEASTYDSAGRVKTTTNAQGGVSTFTYDKANRVLVQEQTDGMGGTLRSEYRYDALGRAVWKKDASGSWTQTEFDRNGRVKAIVIDPKNIPSTSQPVDALTLTLVANPDVGGGLALRTEFEYDGQGHTRFVTEGVGSAQPKKTEYRYDIQGRRQFEIIDPNGLKLITQYVYDVNDNVVARIDAEKQTTRYVYDEANRVSFEIDGRGAVKQTEYDGAGNVTRVTAYAKLIDLSTVGVQATTAAEITSRVGAPNTTVDHVTRYVYDGNNRLTFTIDSQGYGTRNEYDQVGNVVVSTRYTAKIPFSADSPLDGKLRFSVDLVALKALADDSKDQVDQYVYDGARRVIGHVDALGGYTKTIYVTGNREIRTIRYANAVVYPTTPTAPAVKNRLALNVLPKTSTTDPNPGTITEPTLKLSGGASGQDITTFTWLDALGRVSGTQDGEGYETTYQRDGMGRVLQVTNEANTSARNVYDRAGRLNLAVDAAGTITETKYDAAGRVIQTNQHDSAIDIDMGVSVGIGGKLARDLGSFNSGDVVTVTGWIKGDDKSYATITLGNQAGTLQSSIDSFGTRDVADGWQQFTLTFTPTSTMNVWLTMGGDTSVLTQGKDSNIIYDDLGATVKRNGTTTTTTLFDDSFFNGNVVNAPLTGYTATGNVTRKLYVYYGGMGNALITTAAAQTAAKRITAYTYDTAGRLIEETHAQGTTEQSTTRYELDNLGQRKKVIDPRGISAATDTTDWAIDQRASILQRDRSLCLTAPVKDSADYKAILAAYTTTQVFDAQGCITQSKDPLGGTTNTLYDAYGNAIRIQDPNGNYGYFFFNELNQATWQIDPMGYATETRYNSLGQVDTVIKYGNAIKGAWDAAKTPAAYASDTEAASKGATYYIVRDDAPTTGLDAKTVIAHDKIGHQTRITDAMGFSESMTYDTLGNKTSYTAKTNTSDNTKVGGTYYYEYDRKGNLVKETLPEKVNQYNTTTGAVLSTGNALINKYEYSARGNRTKSIEAFGLQEQRITIFKYDELDRQTAKIGEAMDVFGPSAPRNVTGFVPTENRIYDTRGNLIEVNTNGGTRTLYYYDALNRKTAQLAANETLSKGTLTTYDYDSVGNIIGQHVYADLVSLPVRAGGSTPLPVSLSNARDVYSAFDANGRLLRTTIPGIFTAEGTLSVNSFELKTIDLKIEKTYDANGNLLSEKDARGNTVWHFYNRRGDEVYTVDAERYVTYRDYDGAGNVKSETLYANKLTSLVPGAALTLTQIDAAVTLIKNAQSDRVKVFGRDRLGRVVSQTIKGVISGTVTNNALTEVTQDVKTTIALNGLGQTVQRIEHTGEVLDWTFDTLGREIRSQDASFTPYGSSVARRLTTDTEYDGLGHKSRVIEQDTDDKVIDVASDRITTFVYGKNGLLSAEIDAVASASLARDPAALSSGAIKRYTYDTAGRISSIRINRQTADFTGANGTTEVYSDITTFAYDAAGRQTQQAIYSLKGIDTKIVDGTSYVATRVTDVVYDAFGDVVQKKQDGTVFETAAYDKAGRVVVSKAVDGVPKIYVRDANGNITLTLTPSANEQVSASASSLASIFTSATIGKTQIQSAVQGGAHASIAVFDKCNQQTDTFEIADRPQLTNTSGIVVSDGPISEPFGQDKFISSQVGVIGVGGTANANVSVSHRVNWRTVEHDYIFKSSYDYYMRSAEYTIEVDVSSTVYGTPLPGDKYEVLFHLDNGRFAQHGSGYLVAVDKTEILSTVSGTTRLRFTVTQPASNGEVEIDYGSVTEQNLTIKISKLVGADPTSPTAKLDLATYTGHIDGFGFPVSSYPGGVIYMTSGSAQSTISVSGLSNETAKILFMYRDYQVRNGASPWSSKEFQYTGGMALIKASDLNLAFLNSGYGNMEVDILALDASGRIIEVRQGSVSADYRNGSYVFFSCYMEENQPYYPERPSGYGMVSPSTAATQNIPLSLVITDEYGKSINGQSARIRIRPIVTYQYMPWVDVPVLLKPVQVGTTSYPGWFQFSPADYLTINDDARYEYVIDVYSDATGTTKSSSSYGLFAKYWGFNEGYYVGGPRKFEDSKYAVHFSNIPPGVTRGTLTYKVKVQYSDEIITGTLDLGMPTGSSGLPWINRLDADLSRLIPSAENIRTQVDYTLNLFGPGNVPIPNQIAGRLMWNDEPYVNTGGFRYNIVSPSNPEYRYSLNSETKIQLKLNPQSNGSELSYIKKLKLYYKPLNATTYQSVVVSPSSYGSDGYANLFEVDLASALPQGQTQTDLDVYYEYLQADGTVYWATDTLISEPILLHLSAPRTLGASASASSLFISSAMDAESTSHRRQRYNAFGEVDQELDAMAFERIKTKQSTLGRALTDLEIDDYATSLKYNAMGRLVDKKEARTSATLENGFQVSQRALTHYIYDGQGRLVRQVDANNYATDYELMAAGNGKRIVSKEKRVDLGYTLNEYDVFGDLRRVTVENDALDALTDYTYDADHRVVRVDKPTGAGAKRATDLYVYDSAGHRIQHSTSPDASANASNQFVGGKTYTDKTYFDVLGRVWKSIQPRDLSDSTTSGLTSSTTFNIYGAGTQLITLDENGYTSQKWLDAVGRLLRKVDLGGATFAYDYNLAGNLIRQYQVDTTTNGAAAGKQDIRYTYFSDGTQRSINDYALKVTTLYEYDKNGNKTYEGYRTLDGVTTYQQTSVAYDELNRIIRITDNSYNLTYEYDKVGNRRRVTALKPATSEAQDYWYTYDGLNRMLVSMGVLTGGRATSEDNSSRISEGTSGKGVKLTYDKASNRSSARYASGAAEEYKYTADGYLTQVNNLKTATQISLRTNDLLGRVAKYEQNNAAPVGTTKQSYEYFADGRVRKITDEGSSGTAVTTNSYMTLATATVPARETGLLQTHSVVQTSTGSAPPMTQWFMHKYALFDSAEQAEIKVSGSSPAVDPAWGTWAPGISQFVYDVNGHVTQLFDAENGSTANRRSITYLTNAQGLIMSRIEMGATGTPAVQSYYYVDGRRIGESGNMPNLSSINYSDALNPPASNGNPKDRYRNMGPITSDFDQNFQPISASYPSFQGSTYVVKPGDDLPSIARAVWGDGSLWYLIADANNITDSSQLDLGQTIVIPNKVTNLHNNSQTTKVYNPGEAMGDVSPTLPDAPKPPPPPANCGAIGMVLMVVVAVVAACFVGPAVLSLIGPAMGVTAATAAAGIGATLATGTIGGIAAGLTAAAVGAAAGSIASQLVGMATGNVQDFSWSAVGRSAIMGAISAGAGALASQASTTFSSGFNAVSSATGISTNALSAMSANVMSQQLGRVLGLQKGKFDWASVAAAGATAQLTEGWSKAPADKLSGFGGRLATGLVSGGLNAAFHGQKADWSAIAANSFGSALGDAVVGAIQRKDANKVPPPVSAEEKARILDGFADGPGDTSTGTGTKPESETETPEQLAARRRYLRATTAGDGFVGTPASEDEADSPQPTAESRRKAAETLRKMGKGYGRINEDGRLELGDAANQPKLSDAEKAGAALAEKMAVGKRTPVPISADGKDAFSDGIAKAIERMGQSDAPAIPPTRVGGLLERMFGDTLGGLAATGYGSMRALLNGVSGALNADGNVQATFSKGGLTFNCSMRDDICEATMDIAGTKQQVTAANQDGRWGFVLAGEKGDPLFVPNPYAKTFQGVLGPIDAKPVVNEQMDAKWEAARQDAVNKLRDLDPMMGQKAADKIVGKAINSVPEVFRSGRIEKSISFGPVTFTASGNAVNAMQNTLPAVAGQINDFVKYKLSGTIRAMQSNGMPR